MGEISLSGRLPKGDANGLGVMARDMIRDPEQVHAVILLIDTTRLITECDTGECIPVARIRRAEAISDADLKEAQRLIRRGWEKRAGDTVLPLELEDDLTAIFKDVDLSKEPEKPRDTAEEGGGDKDSDKDGDSGEEPES